MRWSDNVWWKLLFESTTVASRFQTLLRNLVLEINVFRLCLVVVRWSGDRLLKVTDNCIVSIRSFLSEKSTYMPEDTVILEPLKGQRHQEEFLYVFIRLNLFEGDLLLSRVWWHMEFFSGYGSVFGLLIAVQNSTALILSLEPKTMN